MAAKATIVSGTNGPLVICANSSLSTLPLSIPRFSKLDSQTFKSYF